MNNSFIKAGVIGHPLKHSKSPIIHNHWIKQHHLNGEYTAIDIAPGALENGIQDLIDQGFAGFNVTLPHKQTIMNLCETIDDTAKIIGAVNTVSIKGGKLHGQNTDAFGFIQNIAQQQPNFDFTNGAALVLGAGGAARAVIYGLIDAGATAITITNRTAEKAKEIANDLSDFAALKSCNINVLDWGLRDQKEHVQNLHLLVNTTSLGMDGKPALDYNIAHLPDDALVNDIVYAPLYTDLLTDAERRGLKTVTGIGMLLHQARPAFNAWFGVMPDVDDLLQQKLLDA